MTIEPMQTSDWPKVLQIYLEGLETGLATFETEAPPWEAWDAAHLAVGRLVARCDDQVAGWAALSPVSARQCYTGVAEVSLYVASAYRRQGVGRALLAGLIDGSEQAGLWTLQATIFAENLASQQLHARAGFRLVGRRVRIAQRLGTWHDTVIMERRSGLFGG